VATTKARPIKVFLANTNVFCFSLPIPICLYYWSSIYFPSWGKRGKTKQTLLELFCLHLNIFKLQLKDITVHFFLQATWTKKIVSQVTIILWG